MAPQTALILFAGWFIGAFALAKIKRRWRHSSSVKYRKNITKLLENFRRLENGPR